MSRRLGLVVVGILAALVLSALGEEATRQTEHAGMLAGPLNSWNQFYLGP